MSATTLAEVKELVDTFQKQKKRSPAKMADLSPLEPAFPDAVRLLNTQECVYQWGAGLSSGQAVLAHGKDVAAAGGPVLLQDGTVKEMTAAEFAAAPKAAKK